MFRRWFYEASCGNNKAYYSGDVKGKGLLAFMILYLTRAFVPTKLSPEVDQPVCWGVVWSFLGTFELGLWGGGELGGDGVLSGYS